MHPGRWHFLTELMSEFFRSIFLCWQILGLAAAAACCRKGLALLCLAYSDTFIGTRFIRYIFYAILLAIKVMGFLINVIYGG